MLWFCSQSISIGSEQFLLLCCVAKQRLPQSRPTPSRSQPSLVQSKLVIASDKSQRKTSAAFTQEKRRSAGSGRAVSSKPNGPASNTHSKPDISIALTERTEVSAKRKLKPATSSKSQVVTAKKSSGKQTDPLLSSPRSRRRQLADDNNDVTTYLLHRMLGAPAQLPDEGIQLLSAEKKATKDDEDKHSEAGTYTIDDEEDEAVKKSVQQARECIDSVFGIGDGTEVQTGDASSHLVRPVIESDHHSGAVGLTLDGDDVFIDADDAQRHYVCILLIDRLFVSLSEIIFRLHRMHEVQAIVADDHGVCQIVNLSVTRINLASLCKNCSTDQDAVWGEHFWWPMECYVRCRS